MVGPIRRRWDVRREVSSDEAFVSLPCLSSSVIALAVCYKGSRHQLPKRDEWESVMIGTANGTVRVSSVMNVGGATDCYWRALTACCVLLACFHVSLLLQPFPPLARARAPRPPKLAFWISVLSTTVVGNATRCGVSVSVALSSALPARRSTGLYVHILLYSASPSLSLCCAQPAAAARRRLAAAGFSAHMTFARPRSTPPVLFPMREAVSHRSQSLASSIGSRAAHPSAA